MKMQKSTLVKVLVAAVTAVLAGLAVFAHFSGGEPAPAGSSSLGGGLAPAGAEKEPDPQTQRYLFQPEGEYTEDLQGWFSWMKQIYNLNGRPVRLAVTREEDLQVAAVDLLSGEEVCQYSAKDLPHTEGQPQWGEGPFMGFCFEGDTLWSLMADAEGNYFLIPGTSGAQAIALGPCPFQYAASERLAVWKDKVLILGSSEKSGIVGQALMIYDTATGEQRRIEDVEDFCTDGAGRLYYIQSQQVGTICYSEDLETGKKSWEAASPYGEPFQTLYYRQGGELFICSGPYGKVCGYDTATGALLYELFSAASDTDLNYEKDLWGSDLAVDDAYNVWLCNISTEDPDGLTGWQYHLWRFSPYLPDGQGQTTLTITMPYHVQSIDESVRMYQKKHPGVEVIWDVEYDSTQDYNEHWEQYAERLALRIMTGDVGDILMLQGSGVNAEDILATDVMADLSGYLAQCPFADELDEEMLASLYQEDGTCREILLGVRPTYLLYNAALGQKLGLNWDPANLKWSDLMDVGLRLRDEGSDVALFTGFDEEDMAAREAVLAHLLLANIDEFENAEQSGALTGLLEDLKALWGSPNFVDASLDDLFWKSEDFLNNSLFYLYYGADYENNFTRYALAEQCAGIDLQLVPLPTGEENDTRQGYGICLGITEKSENKDAAWGLLEFMISKDGFVGDTFSRDCALLNQQADLERYEAAMVDTHGVVVDQRHYGQFRKICEAKVSRLTEPRDWMSCIYTPVKEYLDGEEPLSEALARASASWRRKKQE